ncbi:MAG: hypothetical protein AB7O62_12535 [Pirellulales bacterium]
MDMTSSDMQRLLATLPRKSVAGLGVRPEGPLGDGVTLATKEEMQYLYERAEQWADARDRILSARPANMVVRRRTLIVLCLLFFATGGMAGYLAKAGPRDVLPPQETPVLLIDLQSGKVFRQLDAEDDTLADRRVARALWCPECRKWHPGPSEAAARNLPQGRPPCPVHPGVPLQLRE